MFLFSKSFLEAVSKELRSIEGKKQVFNSLFETGKISRGTYSSLCEAVESSVAKVRVFVEESVSEIKRLQEKARTLELWRERAEVLRTFGEISEDSYRGLVDALNMAMETSRRMAENLEENLKELNLLAPAKPPRFEVAPERLSLEVEGFAGTPSLQEAHVKTLPNGGTPAENAPPDPPLDPPSNLPSTKKAGNSHKEKLKNVLEGLKRRGSTFKALFHSVVQGLGQAVTRLFT